MSGSIHLVRSSRARRVRFTLPERLGLPGNEIVVPPPTVDQIIDCLALDPGQDSPETPWEEMRRLRAQAQVLLGPAHASLAGKLAPWELAQVVGALYLAANGLDAEAYAEWQRQARESAVQATALETIARLEDLTASVAAELQRLPSEIGAQPLPDVLALRARLARLRRDRLRFDAALHGATLT